jgi:hypothetical protein
MCVYVCVCVGYVRHWQSGAECLLRRALQEGRERRGVRTTKKHMGIRDTTHAVVVLGVPRFALLQLSQRKDHPPLRATHADPPPRCGEQALLLLQCACACACACACVCVCVCVCARATEVTGGSTWPADATRPRFAPCDAGRRWGGRSVWGRSASLSPRRDPAHLSTRREKAKAKAKPQRQGGVVVSPTQKVGAVHVPPPAAGAWALAFSLLRP